MQTYRISPRSHLTHRYAALSDAARPEVHIPVDVIVDGDDYLLSAYLPGVSADEIKIEIVQNIVSLQGELPVADYGEDAKVLLQERLGGSFFRKLRLPTELNADQAVAEVKNGILTLTVPKAETAKAREVKVKVK